MTLKNTLLSVFVSIFLGACASPSEMLGWAKDEPFVITAPEKSQYLTATPVFSKGIAHVIFIKGNICLACGDFSDTNGIGIAHIEGRLNFWFPELLKHEIGESTLFSPVPKSLVVKSKLLSIDQHSSVGERAERANIMTSGAVLTTKVSVQYDLIDGNNVAGSWVVTTSARSNSLVASTRLTENIDGALKRNVRAFLLRLVADYSPSDRVRATNALASLQSEVDNKRIALAYLVYGTTKVVTTTAGAIGDGLLVVAQNSDVVVAELNKMPGQMKALDAASRGTTVEAEREKERMNSEFRANISAQRASSGGDTRRDSDSASTSTPKSTLARNEKSKKSNADYASKSAVSDSSASSSSSSSSGGSKNSTSNSGGSSYSSIHLTVTDTSADDAKRAKEIAESKRLADEQNAANAAAAKKQAAEQEQIKKERDEKQRQWCIADSKRLQMCSCIAYRSSKGDACLM